MADHDTALREALSLYQPDWAPPDESAFMRRERQRAELTDWDEPDERRGADDDEEDFIVDDARVQIIETASGPGWLRRLTSGG